MVRQVLVRRGSVGLGTAVRVGQGRARYGVVW